MGKYQEQLLCLQVIPCLTPTEGNQRANSLLSCGEKNWADYICFMTVFLPAQVLAFNIAFFSWFLPNSSASDVNLPFIDLHGFATDKNRWKSNNSIPHLLWTFVTAIGPERRWSIPRVHLDKVRAASKGLTASDRKADRETGVGDDQHIYQGGSRDMGSTKTFLEPFCHTRIWPHTGLNFC